MAAPMSDDSKEVVSSVHVSNESKDGIEKKEHENLLSKEQNFGTAAPPSYADTFPPSKSEYQQYPPNNPYPAANMQSNYGEYASAGPQNYTVITTQPANISVNVQTHNQAIEDIPDYCCFSVFTCICCCWIIGIFAIMAASKTRTAKANGDYEAARISSRQAMILSVTALVCGIVASVVYTVLRFAFHVGT